MVFDLYLEGMGTNAIAKRLREHGYQGKRGGDWSCSTIHTMLRNEKYAGDLLLQKTFSEDHITRRKHINSGQLPRYFMQGAHEAIIDRQIFEAVQKELARRSKQVNTKPTQTYPYSSKIICENCGKHYRRKIACAGSKYAKPVWICSTFNTKGKQYCDSQQIPESILESNVPEGFSLIRIPAPNTLIIEMPNGSLITKHWEHKSRSESWTDEMRTQARENALKGGK